MTERLTDVLNHCKALSEAQAAIEEAREQATEFTSGYSRGEGLQRRPSGIYVISDGEAVKIGIAVDHHVRLRGMQSANARLLRAVFFQPIHNARTVERACHSRLWEKKAMSEWFWVSEDQAVAVVQEEIARHGAVANVPLVELGAHDGHKHHSKNRANVQR